MDFPVPSPSFGLSSVPWLFTMIAREFALLILSQNTALHQFLDDWLGWAEEHCAKHRALVLLCEELGWLVNRKKLELFPQQVLAFMSIHYDLISFTAHPTLENWMMVVQAVQSLTQAASLPIVQWQSIIGILHLLP